MRKIQYMPVCRCSKCEYCRQKQRKDWAKRMIAEWKYGFRFAYFLTLTYDEFSIPLKVDYDSGIVQYDVCKRDIQLFLKRFRRYFVKVTGAIRYFCVSELGDRTQRPHYHMILFCEKPVSQNEMKAMMLKTWQKGFILDASIVRSAAAFYYIANYMYKDANGIKSFRLSSRRPAIGLCYVKARKKWHHEIGKLYEHSYFPCASYNGFQASIPRYLKDKLYTRLEKQYILDCRSGDLAYALHCFMQEKGLFSQIEVDKYNEAWVRNQCRIIREKLKRKH